MIPLDESPLVHTMCYLCLITPAPAGEWICEKCKTRGHKLTPDEEKMFNGTATKAVGGSTENQQYGGARPLSAGRVGTFPGTPVPEVSAGDGARDTEPVDLMRHRPEKEKVINALIDMWGEKK